MEKPERLAIFAGRLHDAPAAHDKDEALALIKVLLTAVEDELTDEPNEPDRWVNQDRMYPPREDAARPHAGHPEVTRYRSKKDNTFVRSNGAVRIVSTSGVVLNDKPGADGKRVFDP